jgi:hypothetical protein
MNPFHRILRTRKPAIKENADLNLPEKSEVNTKADREWIDLAKDISGIVVSLGAAIGIMGSAITYILTEKAKRDEAQKTQLTSYKTYGGYLTLYRDEIQPMMGILLRDKERRLLEEEALDMRKKGKGGSSKACLAMIDKSTTRTGFEVFSSPELKTYRSVHNYYESIGYSLAQDQLDFEIIFDLITLPNYWNIHDPTSSWYKASDDLAKYKSTKTFLYPDFSVMLPLRSCIGDNYFGKGMTLHDFSDSIDRLGYNYLFARMRSLYRRECLPAKRMNASKYTSSAIIDDQLPSTRFSACDVLNRRLLDMKQPVGKPATWMTLYPSTPVDLDPPWRIETLLGSPARQSGGRGNMDEKKVNG